jgi:carboxyl-terminal processing protease
MSLDLSALGPALLDAALKGTVVLAVACAAALALRRASAAARHLVWVSAVFSLAALPVLGLLLPRWHLPAVGSQGERAEPRAAAVNTAPGVLPRSHHFIQEPPVPPAAELVASHGPALPQESRTEQPATPPQAALAAAPSPGGWGWAVIVWTAGAVLAWAWIAAGCLSLWWLRRGCRPVTDGPAMALIEELTVALGIRRRVRLVRSDRRAIPMTWGMFRPVVLLPAAADGWTTERLRVVLLHELAHVRRWDCVTQLLAHLVRGLYWFHPLAWFAVARLRAERELACDDSVLHAGAGAADYAEHLLAVTAGLPPSYFGSPVALGMGRAANLRHRLTTVLDAERDHRPVRRRGIALAVLLSLGLLLPLAGAAVQPQPTPPPPDGDGPKEKQPAPQDSLKQIDEVRKKLLEHYVAPVNQQRLAQDAIKGMLKALEDPYTTYIPTEEFGQLDAQMKAALTGIGAQLGIVRGRLTVITPLEDSPAFKAGVRPGDIIEAIDGKPTAGITIQEAIKRILGPRGAVVKLKVIHTDGAVAELPITRTEIRFSSVAGFHRGDDDRWQLMLDDKNKIAYLRILQFSPRTGQEVRAALESLLKDGMKGLILDLRACPGGFLEQAVAVCRLFLSKGTILTTRGPNKQETSWKANGKDTLGDFPLVVLVNEQTASAAEIVAGALRDHERAVLVGTRTFGKGSVQMLVELKEGGALKVTTAYHYLPSGRNIQKRPGEKVWGVDPNDGFYLPLTAKQTEAMRLDAAQRNLVGLKKEERPKWPARLTPKIIEEQHADPQLAAALRTMTARLTGGEFIKVGQPGAVAQDHALRLEEMRQRRETLQRDLQQLERAISDLQALTGKNDKASQK